MVRLAGPIVRLDVGGEPFDIPRNVLCTVKNSLLAQYFSGRHDDTLMKLDNRIFIDRNPIAFRTMITFIRGGGMDVKIQNLDLYAKNEFEKELSYWKIDQNMNGFSSGFDLSNLTGMNYSSHNMSNSHDKHHSILLETTPKHQLVTSDHHKSEVINLFNNTPEINLSKGKNSLFKWQDLNPVSLDGIYNEYDNDGSRLDFGKQSHPNGVYQGLINSLNQPQGVGRYVTEDNIIMEGQFKDGKLNGIARVIFGDGSVYNGYYRNNAKHGQGKETLASGEVTDGIWENNKFVG